MTMTLEEAKSYLRVDSSDEDALIESLIVSAEKLCRDVARLDEDEEAEDKELFKTAVYYALGYLYEHREEADHHALVMSLRDLLFSFHEGVF